MIQVNIKKIENVTIAIQDLVKIGMVTINEKLEVVCRNSQSDLSIYGELKELPLYGTSVQISNIHFLGLDRNYEKDFKNFCAWSRGEILASVILDGGVKMFRLHSKNGVIKEEEIEI